MVKHFLLSVPPSHPSRSKFAPCLTGSDQAERISLDVHENTPIYIKYIENNTWVRGNTRFISSVEHDALTREISCSTREINLVFPSIHVFFCLLYKGQSLKAIISTEKR